MLKVLILRKKIDAANKKLETLKTKEEELNKRAAEIETAINEAAEMSGTEEEIAEAQRTVEEEATAFDEEKKALDSEKADLEKEIAGMEKELEEAEAEQDTEPAPAAEKDPEERGEKIEMANRMKFFRNMSLQDRNAMFEREDVKAYVAELRAVIKEKREVKNAGLLIPEVFIGLLKENVFEYSKLYKHINVVSISGNGREVVQGKIGEAIWTECCANLNELEINFNDAEVDCFKVGGFVKVCNAVLEDSDVNLADAILDAIGQAIGLGLDKAILYGRNTNAAQKMPLGVVSRLAQTSEPANYPATARPWEDLHTSNIITISAGVTGAALIQQITLASGAMKSDYSRGEIVWVMNRTTYTKIMAQTVATDAQGRIVSGVSDRMPVTGGIIEVLNFIPDNTNIGGFFDLYLLAERDGAKFAQSEHAFFINDATVFKGTARYDGQPVIAEGFIVIGLESTTPDATAVAFAPDVANIVKGIVISQSAATLEEGATLALYASTIPEGAEITWSSSDDTYATVDDNGVVTAVATGSAVITAVSGSASASCTVTVTT